MFFCMTLIIYFMYFGLVTDYNEKTPKDWLKLYLGLVTRIIVNRLTINNDEIKIKNKK